MAYEPILLPEVRSLLETRRGSWPAIERETGVPYRTIQNIAQGVVSNPRIETIEALHQYLSLPSTETAA